MRQVWTDTRTDSPILEYFVVPSLRHQSLPVGEGRVSLIQPGKRIRKLVAKRKRKFKLSTVRDFGAGMSGIPRPNPQTDFHFGHVPSLLSPSDFLEVSSHEKKDAVAVQPVSHPNVVVANTHIPIPLAGMPFQSQAG